MSVTDKILYGPALRLKAGELMGLRDLAPDVADCVCPRVIVPPRSERDDDLQQQLLALDDVPAVGALLAGYWKRRVLVEGTYLIDDFGADTIERWLPKMFEMAWRASVAAVPVACLDDLADLSRALRVACTIPDELRLAVRIPSGALVGPGWRDKMYRGLEACGVDPTECTVLADFCDADFSQPGLVAGVIEGALEILQEAGVWQQIVFQGTHFPEKNPATPGATFEVPRNEWIAWRQAVNFDPSTARHMIFGDYAADCAKLVFGGNGARAIRHYRYTTPDAWLVVRAADEGRDATLMRAVCDSILESGQFAGREFSSADDYIYMTAHGAAGPGNATTWRAINTTHHITRVVSDIGRVREMYFAPREVAVLGVQQVLFDA